MVISSGSTRVSSATGSWLDKQHSARVKLTNGCKIQVSALAKTERLGQWSAGGKWKGHHCPVYIQLGLVGFATWWLTGILPGTVRLARIPEQVTMPVYSSEHQGRVAWNVLVLDQVTETSEGFQTDQIGVTKRIVWSTVLKVQVHWGQNLKPSVARTELWKI